MEGLGLFLLGVSVPLMLRWIPRNYVFGFRVAPTLRSESVWYDANALAGRYSFILGLVLIALEVVLPLPIRETALTVVGVSGLMVIVFLVWRAAYRWDRERDHIPMKSIPRKTARHIIMLIVILIAISALAIWLDLGPVVHS